MYRCPSPTTEEWNLNLWGWFSQKAVFIRFPTATESPDNWKPPTSISGRGFRRTRWKKPLLFCVCVCVCVCTCSCMCVCVCVLVAQSCPTLCNPGLQPARLLCPWNSPGKNTRVGSHGLLHGIFLTQRSNPGLLHCRWILYCLSHQGRLPALKPWHDQYQAQQPQLLALLNILVLPREYWSYECVNAFK